MTHRYPRSDYVHEDGTWYDATPRSLISKEQVIWYRDEEDLTGSDLLMQLLHEPLPGRFAAGIPQTRSSM